ncbi:ephrin_rec_like domain-containing protein [Caerostris darwini]|uniref:Ephrin_rec_like domain-containing protein n=1 Tax=Caerostris darwini TaxID=1538125 RepID=A0AAV4WWZ8_9ARAC|nr:ephrin_rec_like domain-containing protein [Caerostris darwini]
MPNTENYAESKKNVLWEGLKFGIPERDKLKTSLGSVPDIRVDSSRLKCFIEKSNSTNEEQKLNKKKTRRQRESTGTVEIERGSCPPGYRINGSKCFPCFPGSFTSGQEYDCFLCPKNYYMSETAADYCWPCPEGTGTWREGADSVDSCVEKSSNGGDSSKNGKNSHASHIFEILLILFLLISWIIIVYLLYRFCCYAYFKRFEKALLADQDNKLFQTQAQPVEDILVDSKIKDKKITDIIESDFGKPTVTKRQVQFDANITGSATLTEESSSETDGDHLEVPASKRQRKDTIALLSGLTEGKFKAKISPKPKMKLKRKRDKQTSTDSDNSKISEVYDKERYSDSVAGQQVSSTSSPVSEKTYDLGSYKKLLKNPERKESLDYMNDKRSIGVSTDKNRVGNSIITYKTPESSLKEEDSEKSYEVLEVPSAENQRSSNNSAVKDVGTRYSFISKDSNVKDVKDVGTRYSFISKDSNVKDVGTRYSFISKDSNVKDVGTRYPIISKGSNVKTDQGTKKESEAQKINLFSQPYKSRDRQPSQETFRKTQQNVCKDPISCVRRSCKDHVHSDESLNALFHQSNDIDNSTKKGKVITQKSPLAIPEDTPIRLTIEPEHEPKQENKKQAIKLSPVPQFISSRQGKSITERTSCSIHKDTDSPAPPCHVEIMLLHLP